MKSSERNSPKRVRHLELTTIAKSSKNGFRVSSVPRQHLLNQFNKISEIQELPAVLAESQTKT